MMPCDNLKMDINIYEVCWKTKIKPSIEVENQNQTKYEGTKPSTAVVKTADSRELKSLESFIQMKERCISKRMYVQKNLDVIEEARWLVNYLIHFPTAYKSKAVCHPFWLEGNVVPNEEVNNDKITTEYVESSTNRASSSSR